MRELILTCLKLSNGMNHTKLTMEVMRAVNPQRYNKYALEQAIEELIKDKLIIAFEFYSPEYQTLSSLYFLKGTAFHILRTGNERRNLQNLLGR